jgi:hypothetical protein
VCAHEKREEEKEGEEEEENWTREVDMKLKKYNANKEFGRSERLPAQIKLGRSPVRSRRN